MSKISEDLNKPAGVESNFFDWAVDPFYGGGLLKKIQIFIHAESANKVQDIWYLLRIFSFYIKQDLCYDKYFLWQL